MTDVNHVVEKLRSEKSPKYNCVRIHPSLTDRDLRLGAGQMVETESGLDRGRTERASRSLQTRSGHQKGTHVPFDPKRHQESWATAWRKLCIATGLEGVGFHSLRHTFVTLMAERGTPLPVTMSLVGLMSARMTRHYTHISDNAAREAVEKLNRPDFVDDSRSIPGGMCKLLN
jgi:integrase